MFLLFVLYKSNLNESKNIFTNVPEIGVLGKLKYILSVSFIYSTDIFAHYFSSGKTACSIFTSKIL